MSTSNAMNDERKMTSIFERYLTVWVGLCIVGGIILGKVVPGVATYLDGLAIYVNKAPVVSIPIAVCLFFMMYPIMVKIDFAEVIKAGKSGKPVGLTLFVNWAVKPFTMYAIALFFLGTLFYSLIGPDAVDYVKMPFGLDLPVGATYGAGTVIESNGIKMLQVPLWRSYLAGCILLGIVVKICLGTQHWFDSRQDAALGYQSSRTTLSRNGACTRRFPPAGRCSGRRCRR